MENLENEIWKPIMGYEGLYEVSNKGRIKSVLGSNIQGGGKIFSRKSKSYVVVLLYKDGKRKGYRACRLVAKAFLTNPGNLPQVNHKNGIKNDDNVDNLEWCTQSQNLKHAYDMGLLKTQFKLADFMKGKQPYNSKEILDTETGVFYDSISSAAIAINRPISTLVSVLAGKMKNDNLFHRFK